MKNEELNSPTPDGCVGPVKHLPKFFSLRLCVRYFFSAKEKEVLRRSRRVLIFHVFGGKLFSLLSFFLPKTGVVFFFLSPSFVPHSWLSAYLILNIQAIEKFDHFVVFLCQCLCLHKHSPLLFLCGSA